MVRYIRSRHVVTGMGLNGVTGRYWTTFPNSLILFCGTLFLLLTFSQHHSWFLPLLSLMKTNGTRWVGLGYRYPLLEVGVMRKVRTYWVGLSTFGRHISRPAFKQLSATSNPPTGVRHTHAYWYHSLLQYMPTESQPQYVKGFPLWALRGL